MHGGRSSTIGPAHPGFKHGRRSRYLPAELDRLYREALSTPDLVEMTDHIALLDARVNAILGAGKDGDPVPKWSEVREAFDVFATGILSNGKEDEVIAALESIYRLLDAGAKWDRMWDEVMRTQEQLRRMADTEIKRKKELNQMVPVERVVILMAAVGQAVKRNVKDPDQVAAVYRDLAQLHSNSRTDSPDGSRGKLAGPEIIDIAPHQPRTRARTRTEGAADAAQG
jgi:hypothetical protein